MRQNILLACILLSVLGFAQPETLYQQANEAYQQESYDEAIALYDSILAQGYVSSPVFFNLGNAYFKKGIITHAILNYERALELSPNDEDVQYNLRIANLRITDKVEPIPELFITKWTKAVITMNSSDEWSIRLITLIWLSFAFWALFLFARRSSMKRKSFFTAVGTSVLTIMTIFILLRSRYLEKSRKDAIVFSESVYVKSAPQEQSNDLFILHEGVKISVLDQLSDWYKIKLPDGKVGWLPKHTIEVI